MSRSQSQYRSPTIVNVIGVGELTTYSDLDLQFIACKIEGSRLNQRKFPGLIIRKTKPKATILLFKSRKFIIIGAQSPQTCNILSRKIVKDIQKVLSAPSIALKQFKISNIVASAHLGYRVDVGRVAELPNAYKDDKSSGVFMRMGMVKCVVVFGSGKVMLNGATRFENIQVVFQQLRAQLRQYMSKNQQDPKQNIQKQKKKRGRKKKQPDNTQQPHPQQIDQPQPQTNPNKKQQKQPGKVCKIPNRHSNNSQHTDNEHYHHQSEGQKTNQHSILESAQDSDTHFQQCKESCGQKQEQGNLYGNF